MIPAFLAVLSGLFGTVVRVPAMPVCHAGRPCGAPAASVRLSFVRAGVVVGTVTTARDGTYRVALPPGRYSVRIGTSSRIARLSPLVVTVRRGHAQRRDFALDTGIR